MAANRLTGILLMTLSVYLTGCGGERAAEVKGTVTLKTQPLESGVVTFFPESGTPVAAFVEGGAYTIPSLAYGNYRVAVTPRSESPAVTTDASGKPVKPGEVNPLAKGKGASAPKTSGGSFALKYRSADTSELNCKVDQPTVTYPITLD